MWPLRLRQVVVPNLVYFNLVYLYHLVYLLLVYVLSGNSLLLKHTQLGKLLVVPVMDKLCLQIRFSNLLGGTCDALYQLV